MKNLMSILTVFAVIFVTAACAPKKEKDRIGRGARSGFGTDHNGQPIPSGPGMNGWAILENQSQLVGLFYNSSKANVIQGARLSQDQAIDGLVSSFLDIQDPNQYGGVSPYGAIAFAGQIRINSNCQVDPSRTLIGIVVYDQIADVRPDMAIRIYMGPDRASVTGQSVSNGVCRVSFADEFGSITLTFTLASQIYGDITYRNNSSLVNHPTTGIETYLGTFQVNQTGFLIN